MTEPLPLKTELLKKDAGLFPASFLLYGREIGPWVEKARREAERGALVVGLLPARTDTAWFHEHVYRAATEIRFLKGRLKFEGAAASAPFPSMIAVWGRM